MDNYSTYQFKKNIAGFYNLLFEIQIDIFSCQSLQHLDFLARQINTRQYKVKYNSRNSIGASSWCNG